MKHCKSITVSRAELDPEEEAFSDFIRVTFFRVLVALTAVFKGL